MLSRKLVKSGFSSLVVALPKEWLDANKLKTGNQVYMEEEGHNLIIKPDYQKETPEKKELVIDIDGKMDRIIVRDIHAAYLNNYYYIIIKGKDLKKKSKIIKKMISDLIALEVIDESSEKIVAKSFLDIYDSDTKRITRRMDNIIRSMISDTKLIFEDESLAQNIWDRDIEINKLHVLVAKILKTAYKNKNILVNINLTDMDLIRYWEINGSLEKIGDRIKHIAVLVPEIKPKNKDKFMKLLTEIEVLYFDIMKSFYTLDTKLSDEMSNRREYILGLINKHAQGNCQTCSQISISFFNLVTQINDISRIVRYMD